MCLSAEKLEVLASLCILKLLDICIVAVLMLVFCMAEAGYLWIKRAYIFKPN